ncbi:MAG: PAS domain S-box protein [Pseudomonadota bacterium]
MSALRESEERYKILCAATSAVLFETNTQGELTGDLDPWCTFTGQAPDNATGLRWTDAVHPDDQARAIAGWKSGMLDPRPSQNEFRFRRADGEWRWMRVTLAPMRDEQGSVSKWVSMMTDVTEARAVQNELLRTRRRFELALENSPITLFEQDTELRYTWVHNPAPGFQATNLVDHTDDELMDPGAAASIGALKRRALESGEPQRDEVVAHAPRCPPEYFDLSVEPLRASSGDIIGIMGAAVNITERKQAEAALRTSEERFRQLFEQSADGIFVADSSGHYIDANPAACQMLGYGCEELMGMTFADVLASEEHPRIPSKIESLAGGSVVTSEWRFMRRDRSLFLGELVGRQLPDGRFLSIVRDITERRRADDDLRAARDTFRKLIDHSPFGVFVVDHEYRIVQVSEGAQKLFESVQPVVGRYLGDVQRVLWPEPFASDSFAMVRHTLATGEPHAEQSTQRRADLDRVETYDWRVDRIAMPDGLPGVVCHFYDLTERKRHEEHVQLLLRELNHRAKNMLHLVETVARRTAATRPQEFVENFARRIQSLAANQDLLVKSDWHAVPLEEMVRSQLAHFGDLLDTRIGMSGPPVKVSAPASQTLAMALHELATNAAKYGSLSNDRGRVDIRWDLYTNDQGRQRFALSWTESGGPPVTRPEGRGFGTTVIVQAVRLTFGGQAEMDFAPEGFTWRVDCPAEAVLGREIASARPMEPPPAGAPATAARVLVVEDDPVIAIEIATTLEQAGYAVLGPARSVADGLALLSAQMCDAAVLDTNLGEETAEPIAAALRARGVPFISVSGYSRQQQPAGLRDAPLLVKPLRPGQLMEAIRRCLAR